MRAASQPRVAPLSALAFALVAGLLAGVHPISAGDPKPPTRFESLALKAEVAVDRDGVLLSQIASQPGDLPLPELQLLPAPKAANPITLSRSNLQQILARPEFNIAVSNWTGAERIRIARRSRSLGEGDLKELLTAALQEKAAARGELELRITRPWTPIQVPDEPVTLRILDLPATGLNPLLAVRFELKSGSDSLGTWQTITEARVWREIWVTRVALRRGQGLAESDLSRERRDVLSVREPLVDLGSTDAALEMTESLMPGVPLLQRHLRLQPVVHRGQAAEAVLRDGLLNLAVKVEVLEDGAPGQFIRVRNLSSRREMRAKVQNEKTVIVDF